MCNVTLARFLIQKLFTNIRNLSVKELINDYIGTII